MKSKATSKKIYCRFVKRALDIVFSVLLLLFLLFPMFFIAVAIRCESKGNAIFKQKRVGRGGRIFVCYKFRTMFISAPPSRPASKLENSQKYITRIGAFLRRTSLDELPQLYNVLRGHMSLIGPRPLICEEENIHKGRMDSGVYSLRPGITGMAQISGRNQLEDEEKLAKDMYYLQNLRFGLDAKILLATFSKVASGDGVNSDNNGRAEF